MMSFKKIRDELMFVGPLKSGSFGSVHAARDKKGQNYAVKVLDEPISKTKQRFLFFKAPKPCKEGKILFKLQKIPGIPKLYFYGENPASHSYMIVTELLGSDLKLEFIKRKSFSSDYIAKIGLKLIEILEAIHNKNIVHHDIKPENILLSLNNEEEFFLVDFGLSKVFKAKQKKNIEKFIGNITFAASDCHFYQTSEKKHDLESLGYVLLYFIQGFLPWSDIQSEDFDVKVIKIGKRKRKFLKQELNSIPSSMSSYFQYLLHLKSSNKIDYDYLKELVIKLRNDLNDPKENNVSPNNMSPTTYSHHHIISSDYHQEGIYLFILFYKF